MSSPVNTTSPQAKPSDLIDSILERADAQLRTSRSDQRPEETLSFLSNIGAPSSSRLFYRPQPTVQQTPLPPYSTPSTEPTRDDVDNSLWSLISDASRISWMRANVPTTRIFRVCEFQANFLTYLDAYYCLPPDMHTTRIRNAAEMVKELLSEFAANIRDITHAHDVLDGWERAVAEGSVLNYYARLLLYRARLEGRSVEKLKEELVRARRWLGLPEEYDVLTRLQPWLDLMRLNLRTMQHSPYLAVAGIRGEEQRGGSGIVAVEEVSRPVDTEGNTMECGVCYASDGTQMVLTIPCNHVFCKECLHAWFHASQGNSHMCPACRTELFSCPDRIPNLGRAISDRSSAQSAEDLMRMQEVRILQACESAFWLKEELELQRRTETVCHLEGYDKAEDKRSYAKVDNS